MRFNSLDDISDFCRALPAGDADAAGAAALRQQNLTKPPGSLGRLEELAIWLARWQQNATPRLERVTIAVFAGNHGVAARGVSAYPPEVTAQMVANFAAGGAAINQLATLAGAELNVVPLELERPTRDFTIAAAMDTDDFLDAVDTGYHAVTDDCDLLVVGEMGIANTTTAATLCAALLGGGAARWAGRGTGVDDDGLSRKRAAIEAALKFHERILGDPLARGRGARRPRTRGDIGRRARRTRTRRPGAARRFCRNSGGAAAGAARARHAGSLPCRTRLGRIRPSRSAARTQARPAARSRHAARRSLRRRALRSCCCARHWPATMAWQPLPKPAFPAPATDETLPRVAATLDQRNICSMGNRACAGGDQAVLVIAALFAAIAPARAEVRILASPGGQVGPFLELFDRVRESGERVVIDGPCLSACTLVLSTVPSERICVTRRAVLGFHAARSMDRRGRMYAEPEASQAVLEAYPAPVRGWISRRGGLTSRLLLLRGRELAAIYPTCRWVS